MITGRDTYFFGEMNNLKIIWYENIRFYDINNYFQ